MLQTVFTERRGCRYEQIKKHADMLHKLSLEREPSGTADRGQITTILEQDESCRADSLESIYTDASDRAQPAPDSTEEATSAGSDPLPADAASQRLPKVRVHRATADAASQAAIAGNRQNSLPDLGSRRAPRHRSMSRRDSGSLKRKGSGLPARVASQVCNCVRYTNRLPQAWEQSTARLSIIICIGPVPSYGHALQKISSALN